MSHLVELATRLLGRFGELRDEDGAVATEYAILIAFIALVIIAGVTAFGGALNSWFNGLAGQLGL